MFTVEGKYKNGKVELEGQPDIEESPVLITFLEPNGIDLWARGVDETQATDLRARLRTFAEDWNRSEADIYDEDPPR